jgi:hypothetical protein
LSSAVETSVFYLNEFLEVKSNADVLVSEAKRFVWLCISLCVIIAGRLGYFEVKLCHTAKL